MIIRTDAEGSVTTYPPQAPSTLAAVVRLPTGRAVTATPVLDAVSTTVAAAVEGATTLTLASGTGVVEGRTYRVGNQRVDVESVTGSTVVVAQPLPAPVAEGATFVGIAATITIAAENTGDEGFGVVIWTSDLDVWTQGFEIRDVTRVNYTLDATRLTQRFPIAAELRAGADVDYREMITAGWYRLERDLNTQGIDILLIRDWYALEDAHAAACIVAAMAQTSRFDAEMRDIWEATYLAAKSGAWSSRSSWYDVDDDLQRESDEKVLVRKRWLL